MLQRFLSGLDLICKLWRRLTVRSMQKFAARVVVAVANKVAPHDEALVVACCLQTGVGPESIFNRVQMSQLDGVNLGWASHYQARPSLW